MQFIFGVISVGSSECRIHKTMGQNHTEKSSQATGRDTAESILWDWSSRDSDGICEVLSNRALLHTSDKAIAVTALLTAFCK